VRYDIYIYIYIYIYVFRRLKVNSILLVLFYLFRTPCVHLQEGSFYMICFSCINVNSLAAAEMKYMRRTAGYTWTDYKTNAQITK
jgi:hypothetical protein